MQKHTETLQTLAHDQRPKQGNCTPKQGNCTYKWTDCLAIKCNRQINQVTGYWLEDRTSILGIDEK